MIIRTAIVTNLDKESIYDGNIVFINPNPAAHPEQLPIGHSSYFQSGQSASSFMKAKLGWIDCFFPKSENQYPLHCDYMFQENSFDRAFDLFICFLYFSFSPLYSCNQPL